MNQEAIAIISRWCEKANTPVLSCLRPYFWVARDVLQGQNEIPGSLGWKAYNFIQENCSDSVEKRVVLKGLGESLSSAAIARRTRAVQCADYSK